MNLSFFSSATVLGRALRFPLQFIPADTQLSVLGGGLEGRKWIVGSSIPDYWLGIYEAEKSALFARMIAGGRVVFDVGANVGFYTLLASELVGPAGQVVAFEPVPRNLFYLREHLRLNGVENVTVIAKAVSDRAGVDAFTEGASSSEGHIAPQGSGRVETVNLDELVSSGTIAAPDYIKLDVEGAELRVLEGARSLLANKRPTVFLATHAMADLGYNTHEPCCRLLRELGYYLEPITGDSLPPATITVSIPPG